MAARGVRRMRTPSNGTHQRTGTMEVTVSKGQNTEAKRKAIQKAAECSSSAAHATHSVSIKYTGRDGVDREMTATRWTSGAMQLDFTTWWDGRGKEPVKTGFKLGPEAWGVMSRLAVEASLNLGDWDLTKTHYEKPSE